VILSGSDSRAGLTEIELLPVFGSVVAEVTLAELGTPAAARVQAAAAIFALILMTAEAPEASVLKFTLTLLPVLLHTPPPEASQEL
jgi:hypothetical protein